MTIALAIKVHDGVVLAADSASTITTAQQNGVVEVSNIYNNANKLFNLHKALPIGALTWGLGNVGPASISTLTKDLRRRFCDPADPWFIDTKNYQMEKVATDVRDFLSDKHAGAYGPLPIAERPSSILGFLTAGYSSDVDEPQLFVISLQPDGTMLEEQLMPAGEFGVSWWGQPEAIARILLGISMDTETALTSLGVPAHEAPVAVEHIKNAVSRPFVSPAMPIQDAIELAEFLVYTTVQFTRFTPGHATVGGPIDIATVTKHEGFKWVTRKHFFEARLNPSL